MLWPQQRSMLSLIWLLKAERLRSLGAGRERVAGSMQSEGSSFTGCMKPGLPGQDCGLRISDFASRFFFSRFQEEAASLNLQSPIRQSFDGLSASSQEPRGKTGMMECWNIRMLGRRTVNRYSRNLVPLFPIAPPFQYSDAVFWLLLVPSCGIANGGEF